MLESLTPNLMVKDVYASITFYKDVLGFEFVAGVPRGMHNVITQILDHMDLTWAMMKKDNVEIMFQHCMDHEFPELKDRKIGGTLTLFMITNEIEELYERIKGKVAIITELHTQWYGNKEFYFMDCDGYILGFGQKVE